MLTGTPLDLTPFGAVLQGIGLIALLLATAALYVAIRLPKSVPGKVIASAIVVAVFGYFPVMSAWEGYKERRRFNDAYAHFQERCKSAGEHVERVVDDVDGVMWMKWRPKEFNQYDQYRLTDPYGQDCGGDECIERLLRATRGTELDPERKLGSHYMSPYRGYRFVESFDPADGKLYRYERQLYRPHDREAKWDWTLVRTELVRTSIDRPTARYGITWDDLSSHEDRDRWIAGSSLRVIDLQTNEVVAERIGYMFDSGLGNKSGGRQPWTYAQHNACPEFPSVGDGTNRRMRTYRETLDFVVSVLKPAQGK
jgi:hypothetical protein